MAQQKQSVTLAIDAGEMFGSQEWSTLRRKIDKHGAKDIGDGFGRVAINVNGKPVAHALLHENAEGQVVLDIELDSAVVGTSTRAPRKIRAAVQAAGIVPSRAGV